MEGVLAGNERKKETGWLNKNCAHNPIFHYIYIFFTLWCFSFNICIFTIHQMLHFACYLQNEYVWNEKWKRVVSNREQKEWTEKKKYRWFSRRGVEIKSEKFFH